MAEGGAWDRPSKSRLVVRGCSKRLQYLSSVAFSRSTEMSNMHMFQKLLNLPTGSSDGVYSARQQPLHLLL